MVTGAWNGVRMRSISFTSIKTCINNSSSACSPQPYHKLWNFGALSQLIVHIFESSLNNHTVSKGYNSFLSKPNLSWSLSPHKGSLTNFLLLITWCLFLLPAKHTHHYLQPCSSQPSNHDLWSITSFRVHHFVSLLTATILAQIYRWSPLCVVISSHKNDCMNKNCAKQPY